MFNLVYRDGAPENTGHYENWETDGTTDLAVGTLVSVSGGKAAAYSVGMPYGMVAIGTKDENTPSGDVYDHVGVLKIDSDMIFRTSPGDPAVVVKLVKGNIVSVNKSTVSYTEPVAAGFEITDVISAGRVIGGTTLVGCVVDGRFVKID